ncbi:hypothetical protein CYMTET_50721 [Cymbomonas tetramitiformis]|uniref:Uncharacterized protein n=1 Tax=Cymbomonas tetramitiformis TaxID=36881 RepID=A0AAE0BNM4_9CHLO|nr:hypothetical protein CYMTET_50721 [Cymbomonas tetramitiformis]
MSQQRQIGLAEALRSARRASATPSPSPVDSGGATPARPSPLPSEFFNDPSVLVSTPVEEGREEEYLEQLSYAFTYSADIIAVLRPGGYHPKHGYTLDTETADTDFNALIAAFRHVLYPVSFPEFSKLLDLEHDYDYYHVVLNEIIFTVLPIVLRGTALALYTEAARSHPGDGRYILQRLRYEVEGVPDSDSDRFWVKMRSIIINEPDDPSPQLTAIRTLGDKHARINNDYSEAKRVKDLWHILTNSAKQSPYVTPLYVNVIRDLRGGAPYSFSTLCLRIRTVWREELAFATPVKDTGYTVPSGGGGGGREKKPSLNSVSFDRKPAYTTVPVGEWKAEPVGAMVRRWVGVGYPCILCFRMWGVTDAHPDTRGCCPYMCKEAFGSGRAPDTALPAGKRPPPPDFAAAIAAFRATDCPAGGPPVVPAPQSDAPADVAIMTFVAPVIDPSPQLAPLSASTAGEPVVPSAEPPLTQPALHLACSDPDEVPEDPDDDAALHGFTEEDFDWPAFRETPWIPSIVTSANTKKTVERD